MGSAQQRASTGINDFWTINETNFSNMFKTSIKICAHCAPTMARNNRIKKTQNLKFVFVLDFNDVSQSNVCVRVCIALFAFIDFPTASPYNIYNMEFVSY